MRGVEDMPHRSKCRVTEPMFSRVSAVPVAVVASRVVRQPAEMISASVGWPTKVLLLPINPAHLVVKIGTAVALMQTN